MWIGVVSLFPDLVAAVGQHGVVGRAVQQGLLNIALFNPRDHARDRHKTVDDRPYGGGPGMLMKVAPLKAALDAAKLASMQVDQGRLSAVEARSAKRVYLSPQGRTLDAELLRSLAGEQKLVLVCGRYEGVDERLIESDIDLEVSVGDYVLSGGELPAMVLIDAIARLQPGVLGHAASAQQDSFVEGLLDCPHYTRPEVVDGVRVPQVLLNGDHEAIRRWRLKQSLGRTWSRRPDLLEKQCLSEEQQALLDEFIKEQKV